MMEMRTEPGTLLAAAPDLQDPNFTHTVVLMCAHNEQGAHGLVINRPAPLTIQKLLPQHDKLGLSTFPVHAGGPVGLDTLQIVHRVPGEIPGGYELGDGVYLGGELDALARYLTEHDEKDAATRVRMILGYAGWGQGQLEVELAGGSWLPVRMDPDWVFDHEPELVWRKVLRALGPHAADLKDLPPDVTWN